MDFQNRSWTEIFPEGCPPKEAEYKELQVFRLVSGGCLTEDDFKSHVELGLNFTPNKKHPFVEYGISINTNLEELKKYLKASSLLRKKFKNIAYGNTYLCTGVVKPTSSIPQPSHHSWWLYKEAVPHKYFTIIGGEASAAKE